ncbi:MAG: 4Fe-4S binding protein, partial [Myxococcales bacterium]|nr:4Fe-4S binding protein [Myxococcales bacterium]
MGGIVPGWKWRWTRRITQSLAILAIVVTPFLGGWQRVDRSWLAAWDARGWDLPGAVMERLPVGTPAERAYQALQFIGGGTAGDYISIAAIDPVAGAVAFARTSRTLPVLIAWLIPIFLALLAGRVFCGWFCPFGTLARAIRALQARLPWHPRAFEIPHRRPVRWILLAVAVGGGALGADLLTFAVLPHALIQQTAYGAWLLGGGGAVLGSLAGLVLAGFVFGPTTYCAALCPTGAALSLVGRARLFHVGQETPRDCGHGCHLCDNACWLQLHPSTGDPGPDCDACTRCFSVCPRTNLRVGRGPSARPAALALIAGLGLIFVAGPAFAA